MASHVRVTLWLPDGHDLAFITRVTVGGFFQLHAVVLAIQSNQIRTARMADVRRPIVKGPAYRLSIDLERAPAGSSMWVKSRQSSTVNGMLGHSMPRQEGAAGEWSHKNQLRFLIGFIVLLPVHFDEWWDSPVPGDLDLLSPDSCELYHIPCMVSYGRIAAKSQGLFVFAIFKQGFESYERCSELRQINPPRLPHHLPVTGCAVHLMFYHLSTNISSRSSPVHETRVMKHVYFWANVIVWRRRRDIT